NSSATKLGDYVVQAEWSNGANECLTAAAVAPLGTFAPVFETSASGAGIGGYDLSDPRDLAFAFDFDGTGKLDHLVLYRPGAEIGSVVKTSAGTFAPVFETSASGAGIGGYDLSDPRDLAFAFDFDGTGKLDHLVLYRPGA